MQGKRNAANAALSSAVLLCLTTMAAQAGDAQIAVAANFSAPATDRRRPSSMPAAIRQRSSPAPPASSMHRSNGAPFDVLLAADDDTPAKLEGGTRPARVSPTPSAAYVLWSATPALSTATAPY